MKSFSKKNNLAKVFKNLLILNFYNINYGYFRYNT